MANMNQQVDSKVQGHGASVFCQRELHTLVGHVACSFVVVLVMMLLMIDGFREVVGIDGDLNDIEIVPVRIEDK